MKLAFNRNVSKDPKWRDRMPHRVAWNACLLVDDTIHRGVNKAAEKIEKKTGWRRRKTALATLVVGTFISATCYASLAIGLDILKNNSLTPFAFEDATSHFVRNGLYASMFIPTIIKATINTNPSDSLSLNRWQYAATNSRFPILLIMSLPILTNSTPFRCVIEGPCGHIAWADDISTTILGLTITTVFYLISSTNGILDRAIDKTKQLFKALKEAAAKAKDAAVDALTPKPAPVPVEVKS